MHRYRPAIAASIVAVGVVSCVLVGVGQTQPPAPTNNRLPLEPMRERGQSVTPAYEGWFQNPDGTFTMLVGYFNRNSNQIVDIPIGPNNKFEPGNPDRGQPTHFLLRREYGVFGIVVPKDFGKQKLKWTISANGQPQSIDVWLNPPYNVSPFQNSANGNTPPTLRFEQTGTSWQGPMNMKVMPTVNGSVGTPVPVSIWVEDKGNTELDPQFGRGRGAPGGGAPGAGGGGGGGGRGGRGGTPPASVQIIWTKYRGPGAVKFANDRIPFASGDLQKAETTATFSAPGEYWIRATAQDSSGAGGGGDQCCWSTGHIKVMVK